MKNSEDRFDQKQLELIAGRALGDLTSEEIAKLEELDSESFKEELDELEATLAAVQIALLRDSSEIPTYLQAKIQTTAKDYVGQTAIIDQSSSASLRREGPSPIKHSSSSVFHAREAFAWISAAAALILSVGIYLAGRPEQPKPLSLLDSRTSLLDTAADLVQVNWQNGPTPFSNLVEGDVVWSNSRQEGYLTFNGMPVNDPTLEQYQLWIIDPNRDDEPIDGGVFDITESGMVVVKITPKLRVLSPQAFAITIEKPGGVVVSTQERLPLLAAVQL